MIALAADWTEGPRPNLLRWLVPASVALHLVVFTWLPNAARHRAESPAPLVIEVAEPPPPEPPSAERPPEPAPAAPAAVMTAAPTTPRTSTRAMHDVPAAQPAATADAPMDFTSTVFSNDGPGVAVSAGGATVAAAPSTIARRAVAPAPARIVPPSSLARRPRAPGLDAELERQYPLAARRSGISGTAQLRVRILPDGRIGDVQVVSESWAGFGPACDRTVRAARWEPPIDRDGTPVTTEITYTCRFEVRN